MNRKMALCARFGCGRGSRQSKYVFQERLLCRAIETTGRDFNCCCRGRRGQHDERTIGAEIACEYFFEHTAKFLKLKNASVESLNGEFGRRWITYLQEKIAGAALEKKNRCANSLRL